MLGLDQGVDVGVVEEELIAKKRSADVVMTPITSAIMESISPTVAIVRYEKERRPRADITIPRMGRGSPQRGYHELRILSMPSTRPAMAKPLRLSEVRGAYCCAIAP